MVYELDMFQYSLDWFFYQRKIDEYVEDDDNGSSI